MNENILELSPKNVWKNFRELTLIPRPSGHIEKVTSFLLDFGKKHCDIAYLDAVGNVVMKKKATHGMEHRQGIVLQAHCDMVPQKTPESSHDFLKDSIKTLVENGFVTADKTTLGADDGMGVAAIMAVMEDNNLRHGDLEALITIDEETGMTGAEGLTGDTLDGKILINLDSEEDNIFYIGCAGGANIDLKLNYNLETFDSNGYFKAIVKVSGFLGGHSGSDISKNRPNAIKLIFRYLSLLQKSMDFKLSSFNGGNMRNAIPRECDAVIFVPENKRQEFSESICEFNSILLQEYGKTDPNGKISFVESCDDNFKVFDLLSQKNAMTIGNLLPSGVFALSADMPGLVETSNNLSVVNCDNQECVATFSSMARSSVESQMDYFCDIIVSLATSLGCECKISGRYPGWKPKPDSNILKTMQKIYIEKFGEKPLVIAIHAGLECGLILSKYPGMEAVSIGPTMYGVHTPSEKVEISSVAKFYTLVTSIIENVPKKD